MSRSGPAGHPPAVGVRSLLVVLAAALCGSCVDEVHLLGDDRARMACGEAVLLVMPPSGCTTVRVESNSPYGCTESTGRGGPSTEHTGSWVRVSGAADGSSTVHVTLVSSGTLCSADGGARSCPTSVYVRSWGGLPCTCAAGTFGVYPLTTSIDLSLVAPEQELLLEPLGAVFDVSLCAGGPIGP